MVAADRFIIRLTALNGITWDRLVGGEIAARFSTIHFAKSGSSVYGMDGVSRAPAGIGKSRTWQKALTGAKRASRSTRHSGSVRILSIPNGPTTKFHASST